MYDESRTCLTTAAPPGRRYKVQAAHGLRLQSDTRKVDIPWHCHLSIGGRLSRIESTMKHFSCAGGDRLPHALLLFARNPRHCHGRLLHPPGSRFLHWQKSDNLKSAQLFVLVARGVPGHDPSQSRRSCSATDSCERPGAVPPDTEAKRGQQRFMLTCAPPVPGAA